MTLAERSTEFVALGPRVRIRQFTRGDVDLWQAWPDYSEILLIGASPPRMTQIQRDRWFDDLTVRQRQIPFAVDEGSASTVGRLFLRHVRREEGTAVLGIDFHPGWVGQRFGTEALMTFFPHYFEVLGFTALLLSVAAFNERARRCYESLNFRSMGTHWDHHLGPDPTNDPAVRPHSHRFRKTAAGLETLFYDMRLSRGEWERTRGGTRWRP